MLSLIPKFAIQLNVITQNKKDHAPDSTRWATAAKAAIPLVKQNARSALSSFAKRLRIKIKIKFRLTSCQNTMKKSSENKMVKAASIVIHTPEDRIKPFQNISCRVSASGIIIGTVFYC